MQKIKDLFCEITDDKLNGLFIEQPLDLNLYQISQYCKEYINSNHFLLQLFSQLIENTLILNTHNLYFNQWNLQNIGVILKEKEVFIKFKNIISLESNINNYDIKQQGNFVHSDFTKNHVLFYEVCKIFEIMKKLQVDDKFQFNGRFQLFLKSFKQNGISQEELIQFMKQNFDGYFLNEIPIINQPYLQDLALFLRQEHTNQFDNDQPQDKQKNMLDRNLGYQIINLIQQQDNYNKYDQDNIPIYNYLQQLLKAQSKFTLLYILRYFITRNYFRKTILDFLLYSFDQFIEQKDKELIQVVDLLFYIYLVDQKLKEIRQQIFQKLNRINLEQEPYLKLQIFKLNYVLKVFEKQDTAIEIKDFNQSYKQNQLKISEEETQLEYLSFFPLRLVRIMTWILGQDLNINETDLEEQNRIYQVTQKYAKFFKQRSNYYDKCELYQIKQNKLIIFLQIQNYLFSNKYKNIHKLCFDQISRIESSSSLVSDSLLVQINFISQIIENGFQINNNLFENIINTVFNQSLIGDSKNNIQNHSQQYFQSYNNLIIALLKQININQTTQDQGKRSRDKNQEYSQNQDDFSYHSIHTNLMQILTPCLYPLIKNLLEPGKLLDDSLKYNQICDLKKIPELKGYDLKISQSKKQQDDSMVKRLDTITNFFKNLLLLQDDLKKQYIEQKINEYLQNKRVMHENLQQILAGMILLIYNEMSQSQNISLFSLFQNNQQMNIQAYDNNFKNNYLLISILSEQWFLFYSQKMLQINSNFQDEVSQIIKIDTNQQFLLIEGGKFTLKNYLSIMKNKGQAQKEDKFKQIFYQFFQLVMKLSQKKYYFQIIDLSLFGLFQLNQSDNYYLKYLNSSYLTDKILNAIAEISSHKVPMEYQILIVDKNFILNDQTYLKLVINLFYFQLFQESGQLNNQKEFQIQMQNLFQQSFGKTEESIQDITLNYSLNYERVKYIDLSQEDKNQIIEEISKITYNDKGFNISSKFNIPYFYEKFDENIFHQFQKQKDIVEKCQDFKDLSNQINLVQYHILNFYLDQIFLSYFANSYYKKNSINQDYLRQWISQIRQKQQIIGQKQVNQLIKQQLQLKNQIIQNYYLDNRMFDQYFECLNDVQQENNYDLISDQLKILLKGDENQQINQKKLWFGLIEVMEYFQNSNNKQILIIYLFNIFQKSYKPLTEKSYNFLYYIIKIQNMIQKGSISSFKMENFIELYSDNFQDIPIYQKCIWFLTVKQLNCMSQIINKNECLKNILEIKEIQASLRLFTNDLDQIPPVEKYCQWLASNSAHIFLENRIVQENIRQELCYNSDQKAQDIKEIIQLQQNSQELQQYHEQLILQNVQQNSQQQQKVFNQLLQKIEQSPPLDIEYQEQKEEIKNFIEQSWQQNENNETKIILHQINSHSFTNTKNIISKNVNENNFEENIQSAYCEYDLKKISQQTNIQMQSVVHQQEHKEEQLSNQYPDDDNEENLSQVYLQNYIKNIQKKGNGILTENNENYQNLPIRQEQISEDKYQNSYDQTNKIVQNLNEKYLFEDYSQLQLISLGFLGEGGFATVQLCYSLKNRERYAKKVFKKKIDYENEKFSYIEIQTKLSHIFYSYTIRLVSYDDFEQCLVLEVGQCNLLEFKQIIMQNNKDISVENLIALLKFMISFNIILNEDERYHADIQIKNVILFSKQDSSSLKPNFYIFNSQICQIYFKFIDFGTHSNDKNTYFQKSFTKDFKHKESKTDNWSQILFYEMYSSCKIILFLMSRQMQNSFQESDMDTINPAPLSSQENKLENLYDFLKIFIGFGKVKQQIEKEGVTIEFLKFLRDQYLGSSDNEDQFCQYEFNDLIQEYQWKNVKNQLDKQKDEQSSKIVNSYYQYYNFFEGEGQAFNLENLQILLDCSTIIQNLIPLQTKFIDKLSKAVLNFKNIEKPSLLLLSQIICILANHTSQDISIDNQIEKQLNQISKDDDTFQKMLKISLQITKNKKQTNNNVSEIRNFLNQFDLYCQVKCTNIGTSLYLEQIFQYFLSCSSAKSDKQMQDLFQLTIQFNFLNKQILYSVFNIIEQTFKHDSFNKQSQLIFKYLQLYLQHDINKDEHLKFCQLFEEYKSLCEEMLSPVQLEAIILFNRHKKLGQIQKYNIYYIDQKQLSAHSRNLFRDIQQNIQIVQSDFDYSLSNSIFINKLVQPKN